MNSGSNPSADGEQRTLIRLFRAEDSPKIQKILRLSPEAAQWNSEGLRGFANDRPGELFLVAESRRDISGFLVVRQTADEAEILNLAVLPTARRRGVASALLLEAVRVLQKSGAKSLFLEVRESNRGAIAFYEAQGFRVSGRRPSYYREPEEAALRMMRNLASVPD